MPAALEKDPAEHCEQNASAEWVTPAATKTEHCTPVTLCVSAVGVKSRLRLLVDTAQISQFRPKVLGLRSDIPDTLHWKCWTRSYRRPFKLFLLKSDKVR